MSTEFKTIKEYRTELEKFPKLRDCSKEEKIIIGQKFAVIAYATKVVKLIKEAPIHWATKKQLKQKIEGK